MDANNKQNMTTQELFQVLEKTINELSITDDERLLFRNSIKNFFDMITKCESVDPAIEYTRLMLKRLSERGRRQRRQGVKRK